MKMLHWLAQRALSRLTSAGAGGLVDAAAAERVEENQLLVVKLAGTPVLLTRVNGTVRACADKCPHLGKSLQGGTIRNGVITCPWHGAKLNICAGALPSYEVKEEKGRVFVRLPG